MSDCIGTGCKADAMMAQINELRDQRDAAFKMSKCECGPDECCANLVKAQERVEELEAEISARSDLMQGYLDCWRNDKARAERAEADLASARKLLVSANPPAHLKGKDRMDWQDKRDDLLKGVNSLDWNHDTVVPKELG